VHTELSNNIYKSDFGYSKNKKSKKETKMVIKLDPSPEKSLDIVSQHHSTKSGQSEYEDEVDTDQEESVETDN
jgi:hypothetical protein